MNRLLAVVVLMTLSACGATPQRDLDSLPEVTDRENCTVLDHIIADASWARQKQEARKEARNQATRLALEVGANAIYFEKTYSELWGSLVLASALRCDADQLAHLQATGLRGTTKM